MLVLGRENNQKIIIDPNGLHIEIMVTNCYRGKCRVSIEAPKNLRIVREETLGECTDRTEQPNVYCELLKATTKRLEDAEKRISVLLGIIESRKEQQQ